MNVYLGIDVGTSGVKVLAVRADGTILASGVGEYPLYAPRPLWSEQNPDDWWNAVVKVVPEVVAKAGVKGSDVKAIGLSGQMHGSVFLDKNDNVIRPAILWNDQRTAKECVEIEAAAGGRDKLIEMVANPAMSGFTAPKVVWLRNNEPENFDRVAKVLLPKDEIRRRFGCRSICAASLIPYPPGIPLICPGEEIGPEEIDYIFVVAGEKYLDTCSEIIRNHGFEKVESVVVGGDERQDSVYNALQEMNRRKPGVEYVLIHDAARPFISEEVIRSVLEATAEKGAAVACVAMTNSVRHLGAGESRSESVDRSEYYSVQTPQGFRKSLLIEAYEQVLK